MHSDASTPGDPGRWNWLRSQGLGVCCGLATTLLLALGSIVLAATRGGASAAVQMDDFRAFLDQPSPVHLWFYLLVPVMALYALNTLLATWHNVAARWRAGMRNPQHYAAALIHCAFLLALLAHLVGGLGGRDGAAVLGSDWTEIPGGQEARLVSLETQPLPNGMPKAVRARIELRSAAGDVEQAVLGYNEPLSSRLGSRLVLLQRPVALAAGARIEATGDRCTIRRGQSCRLAGREIRLDELRVTGAHGALARVAVDGRSGWLMQGRETPVEPGLALTLRDVERETALAVRLRHAPGNPWALFAAILLTLGVTLMWRRFL